ncbi:MAG TPA: tetratricopeptide repeat protein [Opitutaceae bacterium]|nr:tetratricopeptide repeat protein [Opitutaceae bacterium]
MKARTFLVLLALGAAALHAATMTPDEFADLFHDPNAGGLLGLFEREKPLESRRPNLDPKRIINDSNSFLKDHEPEMTAEEYAVYDKVSTMLTTNADLAIKMLEAMMNEKEPPSPAFAFILGNAYYAANQPDMAVKMYRSALQKYPNFQRAWDNLGILYFTTDRYSDAVPCFTKSIELGERNPSTFGLLGYSLEKEGDIVPAEMAYLQALSLDPSNLDWREGLLRIYISGWQFGRAESLVRTLITAKPADTRYWFDYAGILLSQKRQVQAMVVLEEAVSAGAADADALTLLGDLYAEKNLPTQAVAVYRKVLAAAPDRGAAKLLQFARVLVASGQLDEAARTLAAITGELAPANRLELIRIRADLLIARKNWTGAQKEIAALLTIAPLDGRGLLMQGRVYLEENDAPRATLAYEAAVRLPESSYQASLELANLDLKNRHYAKAAEYLEKAQSIQKNDVVEEVLARVRRLVPRDSNSDLSPSGGTSAISP